MLHASVGLLSWQWQLHLKEPLECPLALMDLSHQNLICICHCPLIGHSSFPTCCDFVSPFSPLHAFMTVCPLVTSIPILHPQNGCAPRSPENHLAALWPTSSCHTGQPCCAPLNQSLSHWDTPTCSGPISCAILCTLFFSSLSSVPLPHSTIHHPPAKAHIWQYYSVPMMADAPYSLILDVSHSISIPTCLSPWKLYKHK